MTKDNLTRLNMSPTPFAFAAASTLIPTLLVESPQALPLRCNLLTPFHSYNVDILPPNKLSSVRQTASPSSVVPSSFVLNSVRQTTQAISVSKLSLKLTNINVYNFLNTYLFHLKIITKSTKLILNPFLTQYVTTVKPTTKQKRNKI